jgi:hypothetical protein
MSLAQMLGGTTGAIGAETGDVQKLDPLAPKAPHYTAKAKRVIYLFMAGAPSHLELFDYKPQLAKFDGTMPPPELLRDYRAPSIDPKSQLLGTTFNSYQADVWGRVSGKLSNLVEVIDDDDREIAHHRCVQSCPADSDEHWSQQLGRLGMGRDFTAWAWSRKICQVCRAAIAHIPAADTELGSGFCPRCVRACRRGPRSGKPLQPRGRSAIAATYRFAYI